MCFCPVSLNCNWSVRNWENGKPATVQHFGLSHVICIASFISTCLNCDEIRAFIRIPICSLLTHAVILQTLFELPQNFNIFCFVHACECGCGSVATAFYSTLFDNMQVTKMFIHKLIICNKMKEGTQNLYFCLVQLNVSFTTVSLSHTHTHKLDIINTVLMLTDIYEYTSSHHKLQTTKTTKQLLLWLFVGLTLNERKTSTISTLND